MIYHLSLQTTGIAAGILLILTHAFAAIKTQTTADFLKSFPRGRSISGVLLAIAAVWGFILVKSIDLQEFSPLRNVMLVAIVALAVLTWLYVEEFLAVRALGMLLLLAADPLLESAQLRFESSRILLVLLAYVWVIAGLFFVGMPYLMRDMITWITASTPRLKLGAIFGLAYGFLLLTCATAIW